MIIAEKGISRKEQIYQTAIQLFKKRGYAASSMRDLAKELDIKAASLYSHIQSKEEILQNICFQVAEDFFKGLVNIEKNNFTGKTRIQAAIKSHLDVIEKNNDKVVVFLNEWKHLNEPYLSDFIQMRISYENKFKDYLKYGISKGEFEIDDLDFTVIMILSSLNWTSTWYKKNSKMTMIEITSKLSNMLIKGIS